MKHRYKSIAEQTLNDLLEQLDALPFDNDLNGSELLIKTPLGIYQLNYHGVTDQLWLSSPVSGAHHFDYVQNKWQSTRTTHTLDDILSLELQMN